MSEFGAHHLRLVAITDRRVVRGDLVEAVSAAVDGGITAVLLREKDLSPRQLFELAVAVRTMTFRNGVALIVSRSVEVALAVGADAVHLGFDALDPTVVMSIAGDRLAVGLSAHTREDLLLADEEGLAYATWSPIFEPTSKASDMAPVGIDGLSSACREAVMPIVALGGITPSNARACLDAGAVGVAAIGSLLGAADPRAAAQAFRKAMDA